MVIVRITSTDCLHHLLGPARTRTCDPHPPLQMGPLPPWRVLEVTTPRLGPGQCTGPSGGGAGVQWVSRCPGEGRVQSRQRCLYVRAVPDIHCLHLLFQSDDASRLSKCPGLSNKRGSHPYPPSHSIFLPIRTVQYGY